MLQTRIVIPGLIVLFSIPILWGCGAKWKKTTEIAFSIHFDQGDVGEDEVVVSAAKVILERVEFEGDRVQSNDVGFQDDLSAPVPVDLAYDGLPLLKYDIPQGTYTSMEFRIRFQDLGDSSVVLRGTYYPTSSAPVPFLFISEHRIELELKAQDAEGANEIVLIAGEDRNLVMDLALSRWFSSISHTEWMDAETEEIKGVETVIISEEENHDLYDRVSGEIGEWEKLKL